MLAPDHRSQKPDKMKPKLYLIPGTQCNARLWSELSSGLSDYQLVHLPIPLAEQPEQLAEQLALAIPTQQVALLGFSAGAYLATLVASLYPEKVARLMLVSNSPCPLSESEFAVRQQNLLLIERFGYKGMSQKKAETLIDPCRHNAAEAQQFINIIRQMDTELGKDVLTAQWRSTSVRRDLKNELLNTKQPLCFVYSADDPLINRLWMQDFAQHNRAVIYAVEGSGHMLPLEQPALLCQYIQRWLNQQ